MDAQLEIEQCLWGLQRQPHRDYGHLIGNKVMSMLLLELDYLRSLSWLIDHLPL